MTDSPNSSAIAKIVVAKSRSKLAMALSNMTSETVALDYFVENRPAALNPFDCLGALLDFHYFHDSSGRQIASVEEIAKLGQVDDVPQHLTPLEAIHSRLHGSHYSHEACHYRRRVYEPLPMLCGALTVPAQVTPGKKCQS